jgi:transcriptional regulator with XRE-family HTH domain
MHLGLKIKVARVSKRLTQQELADKINKTRPLISHIEQTGKVNHYTLKSICDALGINIDDMDSTMQFASDAESPEMINLKNENRLLKHEISALKDLISSQKELIKLLQARK